MATMNNIIHFLGVSVLAINIGHISSEDVVANPELQIQGASVVRSKRYIDYYDEAEYYTDDAWGKIQTRVVYNATTAVVCLPVDNSCFNNKECCSLDCCWFCGFVCLNAVCAIFDGTYRPCLPNFTSKYVVEYNYFSPNRPLYPPPGKPVTPW